MRSLPLDSLDPLLEGLLGCGAGVGSVVGAGSVGAGSVGAGEVPSPSPLPTVRAFAVAVRSFPFTVAVLSLVSESVPEVEV